MSRFRTGMRRGTMLALLLVACALPSCWAAEDDSDEGDGYGAGAQPGAQPPAPPSGVKTLTGARTPVRIFWPRSL